MTSQFRAEIAILTVAQCGKKTFAFVSLKDGPQFCFEVIRVSVGTGVLFTLPHPGKQYPVKVVRGTIWKGIS